MVSEGSPKSPEAMLDGHGIGLDCCSPNDNLQLPTIVKLSAETQLDIFFMVRGLRLFARKNPPTTSSIQVGEMISLKDYRRGTVFRLGVELISSGRITKGSRLAVLDQHRLPNGEYSDALFHVLEPDFTNKTTNFPIAETHAQEFVLGETYHDRFAGGSEIRESICKITSFRVLRNGTKQRQIKRQ